MIQSQIDFAQPSQVVQGWDESVEFVGGETVFGPVLVRERLIFAINCHAVVGDAVHAQRSLALHLQVRLIKRVRPEEQVEFGLARMPDGLLPASDVLVYSSPDWKGGWRYQMTVWASFNGTATWPIKRLIDGYHSAYSSLAVDKDGTIYLIYEGGEEKLYDETSVAVFNLKWLLEGDKH